MSAVCPSGHTSTAEDYCDVCGMPIAAAASGPASPPPPHHVPTQAPAGPPSAGSAGGGPQAQECPHCGAPNVADALFCEACGYDFTTGTLPRGDRPPDQPGPDHPGPDQPVADRAGADRTGADQAGADQAGADQAGAGQAGADQAGAGQAGAVQAGAGQSEANHPGSVHTGSVHTGSVHTGSVHIGAAQADADQAELDPSGAAQTASTPDEAATPDATADEEPLRWVAELWIDPAWYAEQDSPDPLPSPGLPTVVPLRGRSLLVGRPSRSRNITPDVDCDPDTGASRRQAQLTTDGRRWWVEDLDSANGTFVGEASGALPDTPIPVGIKHELDDGDRIYLGAWTRLVVREATEDERAGRF